ncbi:MAG: MFS transporter [Microbacterium sp.]
MKRWSVLIILAVSQFVMVLDSTVMNVSISTVAADLDTTISGMQAAITLYALTMAAFMLTGGKLGDKWGRSRAFRIGSIVYGVGSLTTALSPNLTVLLLGWSLVEGLGAVLVIPAIAALAAVNYVGKERIGAFAILGAVTGLAAAVGPLIGGLVTTYFSWRYVFVGETIIMIGVLLVAGRIKDVDPNPSLKIDVRSVLLSAGGMAFLVFGVLQSKTWGWFIPLDPPEIGDTTIAPLGISPTAYFILLGVILLSSFLKRQGTLEKAGRDPLLKVSLLSIPALRSGLSGFTAQYFAIAALFFVVPVYLQTILSYDALETGLRILPLSAGLVVCSIIGSRLSVRRAARWISRLGQLTMAAGLLIVIAAIEPTLSGWLFGIGMFVIGAGFGLLASQLGNVNMSAVEEGDSSEVGGLQGTFQNLGSAFGTAVVGSIFILLLTSGFAASVERSTTLPDDVKAQVAEATAAGAPIISEAQVVQAVEDAGGSPEAAQEIGTTYTEVQVESLKRSLFWVFAFMVVSVALSRNLPRTVKPAEPASASTT